MDMIFVCVTVFLVVFMSLVWVAYKLTNNPSIIDFTWSLALMAAGIIYMNRDSDYSNLRTLVIAALLVLWSLRLAGYMFFSRAIKNKVDKRYLEFSRDWRMNKSLGFYLNFQLQALLVFLISFCF